MYDDFLIAAIAIGGVIIIILTNGSIRHLIVVIVTIGFHCASKFGLIYNFFNPQMVLCCLVYAGLGSDEVRLPSDHGHLQICIWSLICFLINESILLIYQVVQPHILILLLHLLLLSKLHEVECPRQLNRLLPHVMPKAHVRLLGARGRANAAFVEDLV